MASRTHVISGQPRGSLPRGTWGWEDRPILTWGEKWTVRRGNRRSKLVHLQIRFMAFDGLGTRLRGSLPFRTILSIPRALSFLMAFLGPLFPPFGFVQVSDPSLSRVPCLFLPLRPPQLYVGTDARCLPTPNPGGVGIGTFVTWFLPPSPTPSKGEGSVQDVGFVPPQPPRGGGSCETGTDQGEVHDPGSQREKSREERFLRPETGEAEHDAHT
eukprot:scaffold776_cov347-Pavlova_lutheri.AAC.7